MTVISLRPWGVRRASECNLLPDGPVLSADAIDPVTQIGVYRDPSGQIVQAGPPKHGTQRAQFKSLPTGGGDGSKPGSGDDTKVVEWIVRVTPDGATEVVLPG